MRKKVLIGLLIFFAVPLIILCLNPHALKTYLQEVYNADLLYPFSIYQGMFQPGSHPDWVFGGYTPFFELLLGLVIWVLARNIQAAYLIYAACQAALLAISLLYLAARLVGKNSKVTALVVIFAALPLYLYALGLFPAGWHLLSWYVHVSTAWMGWLTLGLIITFLTGPARFNKSSLVTLLLIAGLTLVAVLSDALFIPQFVAPAIVVTLLLLAFRFVPFRKAIYLGLLLLYATAGGLALYRLPELWGSQRLVFYGSYFKPTLEQMLINLNLVAQAIPTAWGGSLWVTALWALFYALCLYRVGALFARRKRGLGTVQTRLMIFFAFLLAQLAANVAAGLTIITEPNVRYFLPVVFMPLFWGWPLQLAASPAWMAALRGKPQASVYALPALALILLVTQPLSIQALRQSASAAPELVTCMDQNASALHLRRGMANYWQARPVTLFSRTGLVVVQVDPDLAPFRILNNTDGYADDFDFVMISNDFRPGYWMDRAIVIRQFGEPASSFFCGPSEILVYNRPADAQVRRHFDAYLPIK